MNPMQQVRIGKLTLNIGAGKDPAKLEKGITLIKMVSGIDPVKTVTNKRIAEWGLRPGLPIGCKITLRKQDAQKLLLRLLTAKENKLQERNFDDNGNVSFGIAEYIDIPGVNYDPKIGVIGLQVCLTLEKKGYRIKHRKIMPKKIPPSHSITKDEAIKFMKDQFKTSIAQES